MINNLLSLVVFAILLNCSDSKITGGGTDFPNAMTGMLIDTNSTPVEGASVFLLKHSTDGYSDTGYSGSTDENGEFYHRFKDEERGDMG